MIPALPLPGSDVPARRGLFWARCGCGEQILLLNGAPFDDEHARCTPSRPKWAQRPPEPPTRHLIVSVPLRAEIRVVPR